MNPYGILFDTFFTGASGRAMGRCGGKEAQVLGTYLICSGHANMLGLYHLPLPYITTDTGTLSPKAVMKAFAALAAENVLFANYDAGTNFVWVREMARFRMGLVQADAKLSAEDNRVKAANRLYEQLNPNPFLAPFYDRYHKVLHLRRRRDGPPLVALWRDTEAPSKPVTDQ